MCTLLLQIVKLNLLKNVKVCASSIIVLLRNIFPIGHAEGKKTLLWLHVSPNHERDERSGLTWLWGMFNDILIHRLLRFLRLWLWLWLWLWFRLWFWLRLWFWFWLRLWLWYWGRDDRKGSGEEGGSV